MDTIQIARAFLLINDVRRFSEIVTYVSKKIFPGFFAENSKRLRLEEHIELLKYINDLKKEDELKKTFKEENDKLTNKRSTQNKISYKTNEF